MVRMFRIDMGEQEGLECVCLWLSTVHVPHVDVW